MQQEYTSVCTYLSNACLTYMYNSAPIMCWNMAGTDATSRVATCIETDPSTCLLYTYSWSQTLGNSKLRVSVGMHSRGLVWRRSDHLTGM